MPTVEIVIPERKKLLKIDNKSLPFYIRQNSIIISHRNLFGDFFKSINGIILHIGNKEFGPRGMFWASELIDWDFDNKTIYLPDFSRDETGADQIELFKIKIDMQKSFKAILKKGIRSSPQKRVYFYTSIQFGPEKGIIYNKILTTEQLLEINNRTGLMWNTLYEVNES